MELKRVEVECYAGHKADESPRRFLLGGRWIEIAEVLERWSQAGSERGSPRSEYFRVKGNDACDYLVKRDMESDSWYLAGPADGIQESPEA